MPRLRLTPSIALPLLLHWVLSCLPSFFLQLWNYYNTPGLFKPGLLLESDTTIHDAVLLLLRTWQLEQHHEEKSP